MLVPKGIAQRIEMSADVFECRTQQTLGQIVFTFLLMVITNEGSKAHVDEGCVVSHVYRDMTTIALFHNNGDYLMAGRRFKGDGALDAEGCNLPAASLCKLFNLGYRSIISH